MHIHIQGRRSSGRAGEGGAEKQLMAMETYTKYRYKLCLFLFINNVNLKNTNRKYRKSF